ncbi:Carbohydrate esterase family 9 protein [Mycena venus]|uniref:Carbohydrate esterase family 9 protein n=1 Tax=Mycena venus TaxID=2733690 RepID=A0A8H6XUU1_9AGAR|nr:Carbohydrate esterase family 9 protein [Mycena venus]
MGSPLSRSGVLHLDLEGGSVFPGLISYGTALGLTHIFHEASTNDGLVLDPLSTEMPRIVDTTVVKAVDGLLFTTRDAQLAYRNGITSAVTAPSSSGFLAGLSTVFSTSAPHKLAEGAVTQEVAALHVALSLSFRVSVGTQIATLRSLLLGEGKGDLGKRFSDVVSVCIVHAICA